MLQVKTHKDQPIPQAAIPTEVAAVTHLAAAAECLAAAAGVAVECPEVELVAVAEDKKSN